MTQIPKSKDKSAAARQRAEPMFCLKALCRQAAESLSGGWALPQISLRCTMRRLTATQGRPLWHQLACDIWSRRSRRYCSM